MTIEPDTKDWTWVLERPCGECGFDATTIGRADVAPTVREIASRWVDVLKGPDLAVRRRPDVWSVLEYGCHVRDALEVFDSRLALMLSSDDPVFANWDQDATALERDYLDDDPVRVTSELTDHAARLADRFAAVDGEAWTRTATRSDGRRFTVETLGRYLVHDPLHHLWDVGAG